MASKADPYYGGQSPYATGSYQQQAVPVQYVQTTPGVPPAAYQAPHHNEQGALLGNQPEYQGERFKADNVWRDIPFLVAFIAHFLGLFVIIGFGNTIPVNCAVNGTSSGPFCNVVSGDISSAVPVLEVSAILVGVAILLGALYLNLLRLFPAVMVYAGIFVTIAASIGMAIYAGLSGVIAGAVIFGIWAGLLLLYFFLVRSRIPFAIEMLYTASSVVTAYPAAQIVSYLSIPVMIGFFVLWSYTVMMAQRFEQTQSIIASVFLVFSFYWTFEVIKNVVHVSVSGLVATWYFMSNNMPEHPTLGAFKRAMTTSLGSIAFGSLIVAIIKTLRAIFRALMNKNSRNWIIVILSWIALCFLACLDRLAQYFNHYAFCQVAIFGKTYIEAAKSTWHLFKHAGLEAIVNDNIIDGVLWMGVLFGALGTGLVGYFVCSLFFVAVYPWAGFGIGFVIGFALLILTMQCLDSAVATIFVCFAEDKETLKNTKPQLYQHLMETYYNVDM